jgi:hypothetical protein
MTRKSFFAERTEAEIKRLASQDVYRARGLADKIVSLGDDQALVVRTLITPLRFYSQGRTSVEASRKCYKHGDLVALSQPRTQAQAWACKDIPLAIRARDFSKLESMREEEINFVGYSWYPVQGNDARKRIVPFVWVLEGARLFAYAENMAGGVPIKAYDGAARVSKEGASIIASVPSRQKKQPRYTIKLKHVPVEGTTERRAACWSLTSETAETDVMHRIYDIRYTFEDEREGSDVFRFYPHDIAAYLGVVKQYWDNHNWTPLEMSPLALPSRLASDFYRKLGNNVLVFDNTLSSSDKLRKLHIDEKSILIARLIGKYGNDKTMFWDSARDGRIKDYDWCLKQ